MVAVIVIMGIALIIFGGILLIKPDLITAFEGIGVKVSVPVGLLVLGLGAAGIWYPTSPYYRPASPAPASNEAPSTGTRTATPTATIDPAPIAFTSPSNGTKVGEIFTVEGTAPDLGEDKLWLLAWSENATIPGMVYYRTADAPLDVTDGTWSADVGPLGEPGKQIGSIFYLKLVRASPQCSDEIKRTPPNSSDEPVIPKLPPGCADAAPPLSVVKKAS